MAGNFLMIKGQSFMTYDWDGVSLKNSGHLLGINYQACTRWKQLYSENQLIVPHGRKGKIRNKTSSINQQTITLEYSDSPKFLLKVHGKVAPPPFNYVVQYKLQVKCSWSTLKRSWSQLRIRISLTPQKTNFKMQ